MNECDGMTMEITSELAYRSMWTSNHGQGLRWLLLSVLRLGWDWSWQHFHQIFIFVDHTSSHSLTLMVSPCLRNGEGVLSWGRLH